jgi:hypothetical protein
MDPLFPHAHIVVGVLVFLIGFGLHFVGLLIAVVHRPLASRLGIWDKDLVPEYEHFELGIAKADVLLGWIYGVAALGLVLDASWGYRLAWFPGVVFVYHGLSFWFWTGHQKKAGRLLAGTANPLRTVWTSANLATGGLAIAIAWVAT